MAISDTNRIAAAGNDPTGSTSGPMDNTNARAIYGLLDKTIVGNYRPIDFYRAIVSEVGVYSASAQTQKKLSRSSGSGNGKEKTGYFRREPR